MVFEGRKFCRIQTNQKSIGKISTIPQLVKLNGTEATQDVAKSEFFEEFFVSVFGERDPINYSVDRGHLNLVFCLETANG